MYPPIARTLNCRGTLLQLDRPLVMGILNLTPDSFFDGGRYNSVDKALARTEEMIQEGAGMIDIGGYSSRPGAADVPVEAEIARTAPVVEAIARRFPEAILSIDTFRAAVAQAALDGGAHVVNDISAGLLDAEMLPTVARHRVPYILMHMRGTPQTMQDNPQYEDVVGEVYAYFVERIRAARAAGIADIVLDPGFGFGKRIGHNYELLRNLDKFSVLGLPLLVGISRKSMIYKLFGTEPEDVLELTSALHLKALELGASILRVHDVRPAARIAQLHHYLAHGTL